MTGFQPGAALYSQGFGTVPMGLSTPIYLTAAPTSTTIYGPSGILQVGQVAIVQNSGIYQLIGYISGTGGLSANWVQVASSSGDVLSVVGTAPVAVSTTGGVATVSMTGPADVTTLTAHGVLVGAGTSAMVATATGSAGQYLVSNGSSADPTFQTATPQLTVTTVAGASQAMTSNHSYIANNSALTTFTLPTSSSVGDIVQIVGSALNTGGWKITYTTSQIIWGPAGSSTVTTGNAASAAAAAQSVTLVCVVANTTWVITANSGTVTLT